MEKQTCSKEELQKIEDDFKEFAISHCLRNVSLCGEHMSTGDFIGMLATDEPRHHNEVMASILNVARLWQHARNASRTILNQYERDVTHR